MADASAFEWTDATWNPVTGCTKINPAATIATRSVFLNAFVERRVIRLKQASI